MLSKVSGLISGLSGFLRCVALLFLLLAGGFAVCAQQAGTPAARQQAADRRFLLERGLGAATGTRQSAHKGLGMARARQAAAQVSRSSRAFGLSAQGTAQPFAGSSATWQPAGPPQVNTPAYGLVTGRLSSLAVDTNDTSGNTVYLGATGGGVWVSNNANASNPGTVAFRPLTDNNVSGLQSSDQSVLSLSIGAVTVQPGDPQVLLAGTGDPNDALDSYYGVGILRSQDGGSSWSLITSTKDGFNGGAQNYSFAEDGFAGFAWSSATANLVVAAVSQSREGMLVNTDGAAAAEAGLFYSSDAGQTWYLATVSDGGQVVQSPTQNYAPPGNPATAVVWNKQRQLFIAAIRYHGYYSSPDGVNWTRLAQQPGANLSTSQCPPSGAVTCPIFRGALAVQPVTGDTFALTTDINNVDQGLYQDVCSTSGTQATSCTTGSLSFGTRISDTALDDPQSPASGPVIDQADYNLSLSAVSLQQDTILFAGTEDIYRCSLANSCAWRNTTNDQTCAAAQVAPSTHAIGGTGGVNGLYFGTDGGLWRSTDTVSQTGSVCAATDASHFQNLNGGIGSLAEISHLAVSPTNGSLVLAGMGEFGVVTSANAQAGTGAWQQLLTGEGSYVAIDPSTPGNWFADNGPGVNIFSCANGGNCNAAGFGAAPVIGSATVETDADYFTDPAPWILDPLNPGNIILGTCRMWLGPVTGGWSSANLLSTMLDGNQGSFCNGNAQLRSVGAGGSYNSAQGGEQMYAGMAGLLDGGGSVPGHIYGAVVPQTGGQVSWSDLWRNPVKQPSSSTPTQFNGDGYAISSIAVDPHDATGKTVYVGIAGFPSNFPLLYGSTDGGAHWANLSSSLPIAPVNSIVVDPNDPTGQTLYVGGDFGVYYTQNVANCGVVNGNCWAQLGSNLPNAPVTGLAAYSGASGTVLEASTYGRGIWTVGVSTSAAFAQGTLSPASYTFAPGQAVGSQSPSVASFTLSSSGATALNIGQIATTGDYAQTNNCGASLTSGQACTIQVTFKPSATGDRPGTLTVRANVSGGVLSSTLDGTGLTPGAVTLSPAGGLSFPTTATGASSAPMNVTVSNTGGAPVTLGSGSITGTNNLDFSVGSGTCTGTLAANTSCTVPVVFDPVQTGPRSALFQITSSAPGGPFTVNLAGRAVAPAFLTLTPTSLSFSPTPQGSASTAQSITETNTGGADAQLDAPTISSDYTISANACGTTLSGGSSCTVSIEFTPQGTGSRSGLFSQSSPSIPNGETSPKTVPLSGNGLPPSTVSFSPASLNFPAQQQGTTSAAQTINVTNSAGSTATLGTPTVTSGYAISSNNCPSSLAVGGSCALGIAFTPNAPGANNGTLTLPVNSGTISAALTGTGTAPGTLAFNPGSLSFGKVAETTTSAALSVMVTNNGGSPAQIASVSVPAPFALTGNNCPVAPQTLAVNASCTLQVTFTPPDTNAYSSFVTLNGNFSPSPAQVAVSGQGAAPPAATISPTSLTFSAPQGSLSAAQTLTVTSTGGVPVSFTTPSLPADYQVASNGCVYPLAPGSTCTISILFHPSVVGPDNGTFTQPGNMAAGPLTVTLNGTGLTPGKLTIMPLTLQFGSFVIGTTSGAKNVTVQNTGGSPVAVGTPATSISDYLLSGSCPATLPAGQSCTLSVSFKPTTAGDRPGQLNIPSDGAANAVAATLDGTGTTPGALSFNPTSLGFGTVATGSTKTVSATVTNSGGTPVNLSSIAASGDFSVTATNCSLSTPLPANGGSCSVTVTFAPTATGNRSGTLTLANDGTPNPATEPLNGVGAAPGNLTLSPNPYSFGSVVLNTSPPPQTTITATNSGGIAVTLGSPSVAGSGYKILNSNCGLTLEATASCTAQVTFQPTVAGDSPGSFSLPGSYSGPTQTVALDGNGVTPGALTFIPNPLAFGSVVVNATATQSVMMKNTGGAPVSIGAILVSTQFGVTSQCGGILAPGATCSLQITFTPSTAGPASGLLSVQASVSGGAATVPLSGTGVLPGALAASPVSLSYPSTVVGSTSPTQSATFSNPGGVSVPLAAPQVSSLDYVVTSNGCGASLNPGAACIVAVAFRPTAGGDRRGTLTLAGSAGGGPVAPVALDGSGLTPAHLTVNPGSLAFGGQPERTTSLAQTLTFQNSGGVATGLGAPVLSGEYILTANSCGSTLAAGANCTIAVEFAPTSSGSQPGTLSLAGTSGTPSVAAFLSGTGQALVLSPATLPFLVPQPIGSSVTSPTLETIENVGTTTITLQSVTVSGDFSIGPSACGATLAPNTSCSLNIIFTPTAGGQRTGLLTVSDGGETESAQLVGTGLSPATDTLSTGGLSFGATEVGRVSPAQAVTVTNTGDATLALIAAQAIGPFNVANNCGASLGGHLTCSVAVTFAPNALGAATGVLTISDAQRTQTIALAGQGTAPPQAFASPSSIDFGPYAQGIATTPKIVTISNQGVTPMTGTTYSTTGPDFAVSSSSCGGTIAPGASCQIGVVFTPGVIGNREGTLTVASSTLGEPLVVSLSGSGEDYQLSVVGSATGVVTNGQSATYQLAVTPVGASTGTVAIACTGVPANAVCTANPATLTIASGVTGSVTLTIATAVPATPATTAQNRRWWTGGAALALLCPVFFLRREHRRRFLVLLAAILLLGSPIACGVHASGVNGNGGTQPGQTPSGSYNITVNATFPGALRTTGVTLVVQ